MKRIKPRLKKFGALWACEGGGIMMLESTPVAAWNSWARTMNFNIGGHLLASFRAAIKAEQTRTGSEK